MNGAFEEGVKHVLSKKAAETEIEKYRNHPAREIEQAIQENDGGEYESGMPT